MIFFRVFFVPFGRLTMLKRNNNSALKETRTLKIRDKYGNTETNVSVTKENKRGKNKVDNYKLSDMQEYKNGSEGP